MASPCMFSGVDSSLPDFDTNEFNRCVEEQRMYEGEIYSFYEFSASMLSPSLDSDSFDESPSSQQSYTQTQSDFEPTYNEEHTFRSTPRSETDFPDFDLEEFKIDDHSDSEPEQFSQDDPHYVALSPETKYSDETNLIMPQSGVQIVGTTATANIRGRVDLLNLIRTFKLLRPVSSQKCDNNIPKKVTKDKKSGSCPGATAFKHSTPFRLDLKNFGIDGFASGNVFSNGKILLSSVKTDDDELVKSILCEVAKQIEVAHCDSITNFSVSVIQGFPYDGLSPILHDRLGISPQLQFCVPFSIKYSRLDQAFQDGQLNSAEHGLIAVRSKKEKASGHGYLVYYDSLSVTIYHTGKVQGRSSKSRLSRAQLKNALLRVYATLMRIQHIIKVQGGDSFDGSARRHPKTAALKQVRSSPSPSPFKLK